MEINHPDAKPPSFEELKDLEKLEAIIERATADGRLTEAEMQTIKEVIREDGKITPQELDLVQRLIYEKLQSGELGMNW